MAQTVKHLPTMRETGVQSLGQEDLEKEMATHSSILAWKIPWMEERGRLQSVGSQRVRHDWATLLSLSCSQFHFLLFTSIILRVVSLVLCFTITNLQNILVLNGFLGDSDGKESAAMQETWVGSLGQEDPLEKGMTTHSSILAWRISWTEEPGS